MEFTLAIVDLLVGEKVDELVETCALNAKPSEKYVIIVAGGRAGVILNNSFHG